MIRVTHIRTEWIKLENASANEKFNEISDAINHNIKTVFSELQPGDKMTRIEVQWVNTPDRVHNPLRASGYFTVHAYKDDGQPENPA